MKIAFVTTQGLAGSTVIGRILPLAEEFAKKHEVYVLGHSTPSSLPLAKGEKKWGWVPVGKDPFLKTPRGKKRLSGISLIIRLKWNAIFSALKLIQLRPEIIIIAKSLPENVLAVWLYIRAIRVFNSRHSCRVILDVDDFELTANVTSSLIQRAAIHWAERTGAQLADHIITATPFLSDHFEQLTQGKKKITMIPTGLSEPDSTDSGDLAGGAGLNNVKNSQENRSQNLVKSTASVLVYAGSLTLSSGHRIDLLPNILSEIRKTLPQTQLHIHGEGDDVAKLKTMFAQKNLTDAITWHGRFTHTGLVKQLSADTILLDTIDDNITNRAKSSFRVALAGILGFPVVSSDIGIRPYLIPDEFHARFFAEPGDAADYAAKTMELIRQPLTHNESNSLQTHAQQFTWQTLAQKYEKIIVA